MPPNLPSEKDFPYDFFYLTTCWNSPTTAFPSLGTFPGKNLLKGFSHKKWNRHTWTYSHMDWTNSGLLTHFPGLKTEVTGDILVICRNLRPSTIEREAEESSILYWSISFWSTLHTIILSIYVHEEHSSVFSFHFLSDNRINQVLVSINEINNRARCEREYFLFDDFEFNHLVQCTCWTLVAWVWSLFPLASFTINQIT